MHSTDRTMLAGFGFGDPDKRNKQHDAACRYLATDDAMVAVATVLMNHGAFSTKRHQFSYDKVELTSVQPQKAVLELPLNKGEDRFKTTVGFLDCVIPVKLSFTCQCPSTYQRWLGYGAEYSRHTCEVPPRDVVDHDEHVCIEVKAGRTPITDVIRQINLYKEYANLGNCCWDVCLPPVWVLAKPYDLDNNAVKVLEQAGAFHIRLGDGFEAFVKNETEATGPSKSSLVI